MKASELRDKSSEELLDNLSEARRRLFFQMKMQSATGERAKPHETGILRREIARIATVLREREIAEKAAANTQAEGVK